MSALANLDQTTVIGLSHAWGHTPGCVCDENSGYTEEGSDQEEMLFLSQVDLNPDPMPFYFLFRP